MRPLRLSPHSFTLPVLSLTALTLLYDHTCIRNGQLAMTSQVAANFLPLDFKGRRHIKFAVSVVLCVMQKIFFIIDIFKCEERRWNSSESGLYNQSSKGRLKTVECKLRDKAEMC